jgi:hypothetical protein
MGCLIRGFPCPSSLPSLSHVGGDENYKIQRYGGLPLVANKLGGCILRRPLDNKTIKKKKPPLQVASMSSNDSPARDYAGVIGLAPITYPALRHSFLLKNNSQLNGDCHLIWTSFVLPSRAFISQKWPCFLRWDPSRSHRLLHLSPAAAKRPSSTSPVPVPRSFHTFRTTSAFRDSPTSCKADRPMFRVTAPFGQRFFTLFGPLSHIYV